MTERLRRKRLFQTKSNVVSASSNRFVLSSSRSFRQKSLQGTRNAIVSHCNLIKNTFILIKKISIVITIYIIIVILDKKSFIQGTVVLIGHSIIVVIVKTNVAVDTIVAVNDIIVIVMDME